MHPGNERMRIRGRCVSGDSRPIASAYVIWETRPAGRSRGRPISRDIAPVGRGEPIVSIYLNENLIVSIPSRNSLIGTAVDRVVPKIGIVDLLFSWPSCADVSPPSYISPPTLFAGKSKHWRATTARYGKCVIVE